MKLKLNLKEKLFVAFITSGVICAIVGSIGWGGATLLKTNINDIGSVSVPSLISILDIQKAQMTIISAENLLSNTTFDIARRKGLMTTIQEAISGADVAFKQIDPLDISHRSKKSLDAFYQSWHLWLESQQDYLAISEKINQLGIENPQMIRSELEHLFGNYRGWAAEVAESLLEKKEFTGNRDIENSEFKNWLDSQDSNNGEFNTAKKRLLNQLVSVYFAVSSLADFLEMGEFELAKEEYTAEIMPSLESVQIYAEDVFKPVHQSLEYYQRMIELQKTVISNHEKNTKILLDELLTNINKDVTENLNRGRSVANNINILILISIFIGVSLTVTFGILTARNAAKSIRHAIDAIKEIAIGDTSQVMDVGEYKNCSEIRNCGQQDCPSFGKETDCWVESGSFAVKMHCPKAKNGEDCRTCEVYGRRTEMQELGSIINSLSNITKERELLALSMANSDLSSAVEVSNEKDKLGSAFQKMQKNLNQIVTDIKVTGDHFKFSTSQVADSSHSLSKGATEQASSIEEITSALHEFEAENKLTAKNANRANELSVNVKNWADKGSQHMNMMMEAMSEIDQSSQKMSSIIKVIDEIAFQTNLLALNAAVEAARAGKYGKGFAVVAEEVRNLASRSAKAAQNTSDLIESSAAKTQKGSEMAENTSQVLDEMLKEVTDVTQLISNISNASENQIQLLADVSHGLERIEQVTQQNSATAEQTAAAAGELASQADGMQQLLEQFKLEGDGPQVSENEQFQNTRVLSVPHLEYSA